LPLLGRVHLGSRDENGVVEMLCQIRHCLFRGKFAKVGQNINHPVIRHGYTRLG